MSLMTLQDQLVRSRTACMTVVGLDVPQGGGNAEMGRGAQDQSGWPQSTHLLRC